MAVSARLRQLSTKHSTLDMQIQQEMRSPLPDHMRISQLKKQKLHLKDTIRSFAAKAR